MSTERSFWKWLRGYLPRGLYTRIESPISPGVPDVYFNIRGNRGWMELKSLKAPKRKSAKPLVRRGLNEDQIIWISNEVRDGGVVWIFIKLGRIIYVFPGSVAGIINAWTFEQIQSRAFSIVYLRSEKCLKTNHLTQILCSESSRLMSAGSRLKPYWEEKESLRSIFPPLPKRKKPSNSSKRTTTLTIGK